MAGEIGEAFKISYELLHASSALASIVGTHIYQHVAPQGVFDLTDICVLGAFLTGDDLNGVGGVRLATEATLLWRAVRRGQATAGLREADRLMDAVLTNVRAETSGGFVFSVARDSPFYRVTYDKANNPYAESGGFYSYFIGPREGF